MEDNSLLERTVSSMLLIREFEQRLLYLFKEGRIAGTTHTSIGQEANAVGVGLALNPDDIVISNHRGHGHFIAHGGDLAALFAEIMGKKDGVCGGWGGSQHICSPGKFYSNGIQGGTLPLALGLALGLKRQAKGRIATVFIGDGTLGEGAVYESLNMAACLKTPLLIVVEDNGIAQTTFTKDTMAGSIAARAVAFDFEYKGLEYPEAEEVYAAAGQLIEKVRNGTPALLAIRSARLGPHSKGDDTRPEELIAELQKLDPLLRSLDRLDPVLGEGLKTRAGQLVDQALAKAMASEFPAFLPLETPRHSNIALEPQDKKEYFQSISGQTMLENINSALKKAMAGDDKVIYLGEDVLDPYGGAFKVSAGLSSNFPDRVISTPISEESFVGMCAGLAFLGYKPIVEIMFGDFLAVAANQIFNHLSLYRGMYNNQVKVPVVIRTPMGGRRGYGPTHSQSLEKHFVGLPGLQVVAPSFLHDVSLMLGKLLDADGPSLLIESKVGYNSKAGFDPDGMLDGFYLDLNGNSAFPLISMSLTDFEDDACIICYGGMLPLVMEAAKLLLLRHEIGVRILVPAVIHPLRKEDFMAALPEVGPLLVVEEASPAFGFGAEIAAIILEAGGLSGRGFARVGADANSVIASSLVLEKAILPDAGKIIENMRSLLEKY